MNNEIYFIWDFWLRDEQEEFMKFIGIRKKFDDVIEAPRDAAAQKKFHLLRLIPQFGDDV